jgi:nicotinate-nucleotide adenylyltransferase
MVMARYGNIRRIGIFGGTFNPIHYGHMINIELIREKYSLEKIFVIPAKIPVHKIITDQIDPAARFEMVKIAFANNNFIEVSDIEINRDTPSYTVITLKELGTLYPDDKLYLIIGSDSFNELDTWKSYKEILADRPLIVMKRPGSEALRDDIFSLAAEVNIFENPLIGISSSMIRDRIKNNLSVRYLIPDNVAEYIYRKRLYRA